MACSTCGHTIHRVGECALFWCPRCGTLATDDPGIGATICEVPKLVERCRAFNDGEYTFERWRQLGVMESIYMPESRGEAV